MADGDGTLAHDAMNVEQNCDSTESEFAPAILHENMDTNEQPDPCSDDADGKEAESNQGNHPSSSDAADCAKFQALIKAIDKTVTKSLSACKFSTFARAYSKLYKRKPEVVKKVSESFLSNMYECIMQDIKDNLVEDDLPAKLAEFEKMKEKGSKDRAAWRPSGDAEKDLVAHTMPHLTAHKRKLEETLTQINKENKLLLDSLRVQSDQNLKVQETIYKTLATIEMHADMLEAPGK